MAEKNKPAVPRRAAWLELYTVQKSRAPQSARTADRGRPRRITTLKSVHTFMTTTDQELLTNWQERFRKLAGRNLTLGEVAGLLARICVERLESLSGQENVESIEELVDLMVGDFDTDPAPKKGRGATKSAG